MKQFSYGFGAGTKARRALIKFEGERIRCVCERLPIKARPSKKEKTINLFYRHGVPSLLMDCIRHLHLAEDVNSLRHPGHHL